MKILSQLSNWYFAKRALPCACVLAIDSLIVILGGYIGRYIDVGGSEFTSKFWEYTLGIVVSLVIFGIFFHQHHTYRGILRYSSFVDLKRCFYAV
ncbi:MAG: polysaccharide biosynthesis protein, partial [Prevotellaceae bacterium]|nr:polysaccharide biosynthesis protein [Candidatus Faecinaster equi]